MYECVFSCVYVCVYVHVYRERKYVCMHECVRQFRTILHALIIQQVPFSSFRSLLCFLTRLHFAAGRHSSLHKETTSIEESLRQALFCLSFFTSNSFFCSSVLGHIKKIKQNNHMELWDKYLSSLVCFTEFLISSKQWHHQSLVQNVKD